MADPWTEFPVIAWDLGFSPDARENAALHSHANELLDVAEKAARPAETGGAARAGDRLQGMELAVGALLSLRPFTASALSMLLSRILARGALAITFAEPGVTLDPLSLNAAGTRVLRRITNDAALGLGVRFAAALAEHFHAGRAN